MDEIIEPGEIGALTSRSQCCTLRSLRWAVKLLTAKLAKKGRKERKEILPNISLESAGSLIHRPNQRCHLPAIAIEFTFYLPPKLAGGKIIRMTGSFAAADVNFLPLQLAVFCVECELLSGNNTPRCLACGSKAILSLSRVLGGSLRGQPTAHLIADAELDRLVRSLLHGIRQVPMTSEYEAESLASAISSRHHLRLRQPGPAALQHTGGVSGRHYEIDPAEINLEPGISVIAEKAQALTGATGAAIALRRGSEIVCRARTGRTAPDIGCRLQTDKGLSAECVRTGEVLLCPDTEFNPRVDLATCRHLGVRSILVAPLRHFRRTLGVFEVLSSTPNAFDHHDVATMQFLSGMMVAAISRLSSLQPSPGSAAAGD